MTEDDSREAVTCLVGYDDEDDDLLREAIALSNEKQKEENEKVNDEEELLRQAIALSVCFMLCCFVAKKCYIL